MTKTPFSESGVATRGCSRSKARYRERRTYIKKVDRAFSARSTFVSAISLVFLAFLRLAVFFALVVLT
jgi:hypothetical protein